MVVSALFGYMLAWQSLKNHIVGLLVLKTLVLSKKHKNEIYLNKAEQFDQIFWKDESSGHGKTNKLIGVPMSSVLFM